MKQERQELQIHNGQLDKDVNQLQSQLDFLAQKKNELSTLVEDFENKLDSQTSQVQTSSVEVSKLNQKIESLEKENGVMKTESVKISEEITCLK